MRLPIEVITARILPLGFDARSLEKKLFLRDAGPLIRYARVRGRIERIGRGRYRSRVSPEDAEAFLSEFERIRDALLTLHPRVPAALDEAAAVWAWTRGGYITGLTPTRTVVALRLPRSRLKEVRLLLAEMGVSARAEYPSMNELGVFAKLNPVERVERTLVAGVPVVRRREAERLIASSPGAFGPAREYIEGRDGRIEVLD